MKNLFNLIIKGALCFLIIAALTQTAFATVSSPQPRKAILTDFNRINVKGKVQLIIKQRPSVGIIFDEDNVGDARVIQSGHILHITGKGNVPAKLVVYVTDIFRIIASDQANIQIDDKVEIKHLQLYLEGNATADINIKSESLYTNLDDSAKLTLKGSTGSLIVDRSDSSKLILDGFKESRVSK
jgi:hypothetical protein